MAKKSNFKPSSGTTKAKKILKNIKNLKRKVARWQRYQQEISSGKRQGELNRWEVSGLQRQVKFLEECL